MKQHHSKKYCHTSKYNCCTKATNILTSIISIQFINNVNNYDRRN